ncbi:MAG: glycosyltransferase family 4 protein [Chloroflexota bacterium]|nr:glycosyltransferase family 4 protein [Chloroflexota bacterium]
MTQDPSTRRPQTVALDARWFGGRGIGRYTETLYLGLSEILPGEVVRLSGQALAGGIRLRLPGYVLKEQLEIPLRATPRHFELVHFTGGTAPILKPRSVVTIHDVMFLRAARPRPPSARQFLGRLYRRVAFLTGTLSADHLIVVSAHVRDDLDKLFGRNLPPISVIREAPHPVFSRSTDSRERTEALNLRRVTERGFFLHLGGTDPRKNTATVLGAFAEFCRAGGRSDLVITGLSSRSQSTLTRDMPSGARKRLHIGGFCPDADLVALLQSSVALVFVSSDEGFGLPAIEAMAAGAALIGSDIPAMREVAGDNALFVPPRDPVALRDAMLQAESDDALLRRLRTNGPMRVEPTDYLRMAGQTADVYRKLLDGVSSPP